jgi:cytochrome P450
MSQSAAPVIPSHVPPELIRPWPFVLGAVSQDPPHDFAADIHKGPAIFYAHNAFPGGTPAWIARRDEDLRSIYMDHEHFTTKDFSPFSRLEGGNWRVLPIEFDPPQHTLYRMMMNPQFTPKRMAQLEDKIRHYAREYVLGFRDRGSCEFMSDFAFEFPIKVFLELMGLPLELTPSFMEWEHKLLHEPDINEVAAGTKAVINYLRGEIEDRRKNPRDDLVTFGVQAEIEGRKLDEDEVLGFCFNLFIGGLDTVSTNMGLQFRHLAEHQEHQALLRAEPERISDALDEMMRAYAAVTTFRTCVKETVVAGVTIKPGDMVGLSTLLAGRDPEVYDRPNEVILDRKPRHVGFGFGPHLCIGMHLAKREMRIAIEEFLKLLPPFSIAPGVKVKSYLASMVRPVELPLVWKV